MVLIVTPASEINKAEKWKWWLWFPWAWCGICDAAANSVFMSLFRVPAQYRHTESLIRTHGLMEDSSMAQSGLWLERCWIYPPQSLLPPANVPYAVPSAITPTPVMNGGKNWIWQIISLSALSQKTVKSLPKEMYKCQYNIQEGFECFCLNNVKSLQYDSISVPELSKRSTPAVWDLCFSWFTFHCL